MFSSSQRSKRQRGVILSSSGWQRLQVALAIAEKANNGGMPYTLENLNELTGLSCRTLTKVRRQQNPVDKQTLKEYFQAFDLELTERDYVQPLAKNTTGIKSKSAEIVVDDLSAPSQQQLSAEETILEEPPLPEGQIGLYSRFYVERCLRLASQSPEETNCYKTILQPGSLIRIKAPRRMGKTSLMVRILDNSAQQGCQTVFLSLQMADRNILRNLDKFLQWFSASVGLAMGLPNKLSDYWDELFGSKISCKIYFEQYLLAKLDRPLVLALDDVDRLFDYPELADEFFGLLRSWHEQAKNRGVWQQLRLIVAHSTEVYIPLNVNKSPFNVGLLVELNSLTYEQTKYLARQYGLNISEAELAKLRDISNGQPYLVQLGLYALWQSRNSLTPEKLLEQAIMGKGIYADHLQRLSWTLEKDTQLTSAFQKVLQASEPVEMELLPAFGLESLGLVHLQGNQAIPSCTLYQRYFSDRLLH